MDLNTDQLLPRFKQGGLGRKVQQHVSEQEQEQGQETLRTKITRLQRAAKRSRGYCPQLQELSFEFYDAD